MKIKSLPSPFPMNNKLSVVGSNLIHSVCFILVNFVSVLVVLRAETAFSVLFDLKIIKKLHDDRVYLDFQTNKRKLFILVCVFNHLDS